MDTAVALAGEMGKADAFIKGANNELSTSKITPETTLNNYYESAIGKELYTSLMDSRVFLTYLVDNSKPANSELNSMYDALKTLKTKYNDCCNFIDSPGKAEDFQKNSTTYINGFTSALTALNFDKFITSSYTSYNKDQAYAVLLKSAQNCINNSATSFSNLQTTMIKLGDIRFTGSAATSLDNNVSTYLDGVYSLGKLNAYRLMLLGVTSSYSGSYNDVSTAYSSLTTASNCNLQIKNYTLDNYKTETNTAIAKARLSSSNINTAIAGAI